MILSKESIMSDIETAKAALGDTSGIDGRMAALKKELEEMEKEFDLLVRMNTRSQQDQAAWRKKYAELEDRYKGKETEYKKLNGEKEERKLKASNFDAFLAILRKGEQAFSWDETIFNFVLEKGVVHKDKSITFKFYSGYEVTIKAGE